MKRSTIPSVVCAVLALLASCSSDYSADRPPVVSNSPAGKRIDLVKIAVMGADDPNGPLNEVPFTMGQDFKGRFYLAWAGATSVPVFDKVGKFVRHIGSKGSGPGEFLSAGIVHVGIGDTVRVVDSQNGRISLFTPDGRFVKGLSAPIQFDGATQLPSGEMLLNARRLNETGVAHAAQVMDGEGRIVRSLIPVTPGPAAL